jgi:hypothetical protein
MVVFIVLYNNFVVRICCDSGFTTFFSTSVRLCHLEHVNTI